MSGSSAAQSPAAPTRGPADAGRCAGAVSGWPHAAAGSWPMRVLRAGVFAGASTALGVAAHRLSGGVVSGPVAAFAVAVLFLTGLLLSGRERRGGQIAVLVLITQAGLHAGLMLAGLRAAAAHGRAETLSWAVVLFCHHGAQPISAVQVHAARASLTGPSMTMDMAAGHGSGLVSLSTLTMLGAHLVAAAAMAWWLRRGERAAWAAAGRVIRRLRPVVVAVATPVPVRFVLTSGWAVVATRWAGPLSGRGPPVPPGSWVTA